MDRCRGTPPRFHLTLPVGIVTLNICSSMKPDLFAASHWRFRRMTHSSRILLFILLCGAVPAALGCSREKSGAAPANASQAERKIAITVARTDAQDVERSVQIVGTLMAQDEVTLANEVPATIAKILVDLGDRVRAGQVLIKLDEREPRLEVERMTANLQAAREALSRARQILDSSRANVERAQAVLSDAQVNLKRFQELFAATLSQPE